MAPYFRNPALARPLLRTGQTLLIGGLCLGLVHDPALAQSTSRTRSTDVQQKAAERKARWSDEPWYQRPAPWHADRDRRSWDYPKRPHVALPEGVMTADEMLRSEMASMGDVVLSWQTGRLSPIPTNSAGHVETLVDIDGDGDYDAFRTNTSIAGTLNFFENVGSASVPEFTERSGSANPLNAVGVTSRGMVPAFVDIDDDGDFDVFVGGFRSGEVTFFENTGTATNPEFVDRGDHLLDGTSIYHPRPVFADIDNDGDYDAFLEGYYYQGIYSKIEFFENTGSPTNAEFEARTDEANPFHNFIGYETRFALTLADIDADGDLDAFIGFILIENRGTPADPAFMGTSSPGPLSHFGKGDSHLHGSIPNLVDIDADGDLDAFIDADFFENVGTATEPHFPRPASRNPFHLIDVGYDPKPFFVDIDNDGDFDAFVGSALGCCGLFENTGTADEPIFLGRSSTTTFPSGARSAPSTFGWGAHAFVDIDADGDFDAFTGSDVGSISFFENIGTVAEAAFLLVVDHPLSEAEVGAGTRVSPAFIDIDDDGDFDAFIGAGEYHDAAIHFFENVGTPQSANFTERTGSANPMNGLTYLDGSIGGLIPAVADIDLDGDFDVLIGSIGGNVRLFENVGTTVIPSFVEQSPPGITRGGDMSAPAFVDIDDDGDSDIFIGFGRPLGYYYPGYYDRFSRIVWLRNETSPPSDSTPPECEIVSIDNGPPTRLDIRVQDDGSGLASITVLNDLNSTISWPSFPVGSTDEVVVVAEKIKQAKRSVVALRVVDVAGNATECDPVLTTLTADVPEAFLLDQNYPNPFNPQTKIRLQIADEAHVRLAIYDVTGREVMMLVDAPTAAGTYEVEWDGRDAMGQVVPSGLYFYRMRAGIFEQARTMMIVR